MVLDTFSFLHFFFFFLGLSLRTKLAIFVSLWPLGILIQEKDLQNTDWKPAKCSSVACCVKKTKSNAFMSTKLIYVHNVKVV